MIGDSSKTSVKGFLLADWPSEDATPPEFSPKASNPPGVSFDGNSRTGSASSPCRLVLLDAMVWDDRMLGAREVSEGRSKTVRSKPRSSSGRKAGSSGRLSCSGLARLEQVRWWPCQSTHLVLPTSGSISSSFMTCSIPLILSRKLCMSLSM